jgi:hypothetical protein
VVILLGQFEEGYYQGHGELGYVFSNGKFECKYKGGFENVRYSGRGILISYDDGITAKKGHEGEFKNDDFHGEGTCIIYGDDGITVRQGLEGV